MKYIYYLNAGCHFSDDLILQKFISKQLCWGGLSVIAKHGAKGATLPGLKFYLDHFLCPNGQVAKII